MRAKGDARLLPVVSPAGKWCDTCRGPQSYIKEQPFRVWGTRGSCLPLIAQEQRKLSVCVLFFFFFFGGGGGLSQSSSRTDATLPWRNVVLLFIHFPSLSWLTRYNHIEQYVSELFNTQRRNQITPDEMVLLLWEFTGSTWTHEADTPGFPFYVSPPHLNNQTLLTLGMCIY